MVRESVDIPIRTGSVYLPSPKALVEDTLTLMFFDKAHIDNVMSKR